MIAWIKDKLADRRARKEAERRAKILAIRRKLLKIDSPEMSPTGVFETVKRQVDAATESSRQARATARKILDSDE